MRDTATALGRSQSWVAQARSAFIRGAKTGPTPKAGRGGRRRALLSHEDEIALVKAAVVLSNRFNSPGIRGQLRELLKERGLDPHASTLTAMLNRSARALALDQTVAFFEANHQDLSKRWLGDLPLVLQRKYRRLLQF